MAAVARMCAAGHDRVTISGRILDIQERAGSIRLQLCEVVPEGTLSETDWEETSAIADVSFSYVAAGMHVVLEGTPRLFEEASNPGQFSMKRYYESRGILFRLDDAEVVMYRKDTGWRSGLWRLRALLHTALGRVFSEADSQVLSAMLLGEKWMLSDEIRSVYQEGGIFHILAVSGLHMSLIGMFLYRLLRRCRAGFAASGAVSFLILAGYTLMTGMSISSRRALLMFGIWVLSQVSGRKADLPVSACISAAILAGVRPQVLYESSFCLSFGCVLSLAALTGMYQDILPGPSAFRKIISPGLAIMTGTLPLTCWFYYQITPYSILINLLVLPCAGIVFATGIGAALTGLLWPAAGLVLSGPCRILLRFFWTLCRAERLLPGGVWITGRPQIAQILFYYGLLGMMAAAAVNSHAPAGRKSAEDSQEGLKKKCRRVRAAVLTFHILLFGAVLLRLPVRLQTVFLDVGQGECILIRTGSHAVLYDCGSSSVKDVWKYRISPCLKYYGIRRLDYVILSHGDEDHVNGLAALLDDYERNLGGMNASDISVSRVACAAAGLPADEGLQRIARRCRSQGIPFNGISAGDHLSLGDETEIVSLYPDSRQAALCEGDANQASLVVLLTSPGLELLLTGDLEKEGEQRFLNGWNRSASGGEESVRVLTAGHHGSGNATSEELLRLFRPDAAVISCGLNNLYGHPAQTTLERLSEVSSGIFRTDLQGAVFLERKSGKVRMYTFRNPAVHS